MAEKTSRNNARISNKKKKPGANEGRNRTERTEKKIHIPSLRTSLQSANRKTNHIKNTQNARTSTRKSHLGPNAENATESLDGMQTSSNTSNTNVPIWEERRPPRTLQLKQIEEEGPEKRKQHGIYEGATPGDKEDEAIQAARINEMKWTTTKSTEEETTTTQPENNRNVSGRPRQTRGSGENATGRAAI